MTHSAHEPRLVVGQAGFGYWGRNLARNFDDLAELRWLCDASPTAQTEFAGLYPSARVTGDFAEMLADDDLDAVVIATPVPTHYSLAKQALEAGKHVFVEKPMAGSLAQAESLITLATARGLVLMPGHLMLHHPSFIALREIADSGKLGDVLSVQSDRLSPGPIVPGLSVLWDLGPHDISMVLALVDEEPTRVAARGTDDAVYCHLDFPSGVTAHIHLSRLNARKTRQVSVIGSRGIASFDDTVLDGLVVSDRSLLSRMPASDWEVRPVSAEEPLRAECEHFLHLVMSGWDGAEMRDGLQVVQALEAIQAALST